jgi:hypothetical protein
MKYKFATVALMTAALAAAPIAPANAGWHHDHRGLPFGVFAAGAAVTGALVALATAPFSMAAAASAPPPAPAPVYYAAPAPYAYAPAYPPRQVVVYGYPQQVYAYPQ